MFAKLDDEGYLTTQTPGNQRVCLYAESETSIFTKRHPWRITFEVSEAGEALGVTSEYPGEVHSGPKVNDEDSQSRLRPLRALRATFAQWPSGSATQDTLSEIAQIGSLVVRA